VKAWRKTYRVAQTRMDFGVLGSPVKPTPPRPCGQRDGQDRCTRPAGHAGPHQTAKLRTGPKRSWD
jgi:hypothetical protein